MTLAQTKALFAAAAPKAGQTEATLNALLELSLLPAALFAVRAAEASALPFKAAIRFMESAPRSPKFDASKAFAAFEDAAFANVLPFAPPASKTPAPVAEPAVETVTEVVAEVAPEPAVALATPAAEPAANPIADLEAALEEAVAEFVEVAVAAEIAGSEAVETLVEAVSDDLTKIVGIGPKVAAALAERGVTNYSQIAAWTVNDIARFDSELKLLGRISRNAWVAQAKTLAGVAED